MVKAIVNVTTIKLKLSYEKKNQYTCIYPMKRYQSVSIVISVLISLMFLLYVCKFIFIKYEIQPKIADKVLRSRRAEIERATFDEETTQVFDIGIYRFKLSFHAH